VAAENHRPELISNPEKSHKYISDRLIATEFRAWAGSGTAIQKNRQIPLLFFGKRLTRSFVLNETKNILFMKKVILLSCVMIVSATAFSQDFKSFRVGLGTGFASPAGSGAKGGALVYLEPSYRVSDDFAIGLRAEVAVMAQGTVFSGTNATSFHGTVSGNASYSLNGQYYFLKGGFRPFIGAGIGAYHLASESVNETNVNGSTISNNGQAVSLGTKVGFYPRIGFDASHFVLTVEYNVLGNSVNTYTITSDGVSSNQKGTTKNNYLGVKFGFFLGGGRR
jgi:outer membrane protein W